MSRDRVPDRRWSELIGHARLLLDQVGLGWAVDHARFVCGIDPTFAGLHRYTAASYGRDYATTAHACYPHHLTRPAADRVPTVVLPVLVTPATVVHEVGHLLHWHLALGPVAAPVNWYAATSPEEAFAEAVRVHAAGPLPGRFGFDHDRERDILASDRATLRLFEGLGDAS